MNRKKILGKLYKIKSAIEHELKKEAREFVPDVKHAGRAAVGAAKRGRGWVKRATGLSPDASKKFFVVDATPGQKALLLGEFNSFGDANRAAMRFVTGAVPVAIAKVCTHGARGKSNTIAKYKTGTEGRAVNMNQSPTRGRRSPASSKAHLWWIARTPWPTPKFIVSIGDPYEKGMKLMASLHDMQALHNWILDNVGVRVSVNHIHDATKLAAVKKLLDRKREELT